MTMLVRLRPLDDRKGHKVGVYSYAGLRFYVDRGWYEVSDDIAEMLKDLHQEHYDEDSPRLFDICTEDQATALEEKEKQAELNAKASARRPAQPVRTRVAKQPQRPSSGSGDMTTADLDNNTLTPEQQLNPPDDDEDDDADNPGRIAGIGRVDSGESGPKHRKRQK